MIAFLTHIKHIKLDLRHDSVRHDSIAHNFHVSATWACIALRVLLVPLTFSLG